MILQEFVHKCFEDTPDYMLSNVFLCFQDFMIESLKVNGANNFKQPYMVNAEIYFFIYFIFFTYL